MKTASQTASPYRSTLHRDGSVTIWDVYEQCWTRQTRLSDEQSASLDRAERARIARHLARAAVRS